MTTKYITTYVTGGYTLAAIYSTLSISSTGGVGGPGVFSGHTATIINDGRIVGSSIGVYLAEGGRLVNGSPSDLTAYIGHGVEALRRNLTAVNYGTIGGNVFSFSGGSLTNGSDTNRSAAIEGAVTSTQVKNFGAISGSVDAAYSGHVVNGSASDTTAIIEGGVGLFRERSGRYSTLVNFGTVTSAANMGAVAIRYTYDSSITNGSNEDAAALISGQTYGLYLRSGGFVTNFATIEGHDGIDVNGGFFSVSNVGTISGDSATGVGVLVSSGSADGIVRNGSNADRRSLIQGYTGLEIDSIAFVDNGGTIAGLGVAGGYGVLLGGANSALTNGAAGYVQAVIKGFVGVECTAPATVTNFGTIAGKAGGAVVFKSSGDVLVVENWSSFLGAVLGGGGTLDLDTGTGELTGLPGDGAIRVRSSLARTTFSDFATLEIGSTASFNLAGDGSVGAGQSVIDAGSLSLGASRGAGIVNMGLIEATGAGVLTVGPVTSDGTIATMGGAVTVTGPVTGTGVVQIDGGTVDVATAFDQNVTFTGATGVLGLGQSQSYTGTIAGFSFTGGTSLDLGDIGFVSSNEATYSGTVKGGVLTVTDGTHTAHIAFKGDYRASTFTAASDGRGGVIITDPRSFAHAISMFGSDAGAVVSSFGSSGLSGDASGDPGHLRLIMSGHA